MVALIIYSKNGSNVYILAIFVLGSKFGISSAFNTAYCANTIVFPVSVVATTYGICNFFSRVLTIGAPYVAELTPDWIPKMVFCVVVAIAFVTASMLRIK